MESLRSVCYKVTSGKFEGFQSFLWNGILTKKISHLKWYGIFVVSILLMKWNPYEVTWIKKTGKCVRSFNPSYEMESLRRGIVFSQINSYLKFQSFLWNGILTKSIFFMLNSSIICFNPSYEMESLRRINNAIAGNWSISSFNPSYEMESLRSFFIFFVLFARL